MKNQMIFKRYEIKYLLNQQQKARILSAMAPYMTLDEFGRTVIRNIYFDTDTYQLIRRSIEKPVYKEKLRIRSYQKVQADDPVFIELKKKYRSVVYKRRMIMSEKEAMDCLCSRTPLPTHTQIAQEIDYFCNYYPNLHPAVFLSYEREAYYANDGSDFRVTFDENILSRTDRLSLCEEPGGTPLLDRGQIIMELKTSGGIPLWMTHCLTQNRIFKTSFSKYGTTYQKIILPQYQGGRIYA